jgi:glycosylphosphatidylinositol deacylase
MNLFCACKIVSGNAGSHKQVRSLASVALRKAIDETKYRTHFDFFAVDFGEEMSGLYGGVLQDQSRCK